MTTAPAHEDVYRQVYDEYLAHAQSPAWRMAFQIALGEWLRDIATYHQGPIQAIADRAMIRQLDATRDDITKRFLLTRLEEIRKEKKFDPRLHPRDREGHWARKGSAGGPGPATPGISRRQPTPEWARSDRSKNADAVIADRLRRLRAGNDADPVGPFAAHEAVGLGARPVALDVTENAGDHKEELLRRQAEMTYLLQEKTLDPKDKQRIQYTITGPNGTRVAIPTAGQLPDGIDFDGGERVQYMAPVGPDNPTTVAGKVMDIGLVAGLDRDHAAKAGSVVSDIHDALNTTDWGQRLTAVANVGRVMASASPVAAQAHAVASLVNLLGPDAARAFGPKMRQLSYRYTGQEALPTQFSEVARDGRQADSRGELESVQAFEGKLAIDLAKGLPTETEYKAAMQAGTTPPSKGYLLNKNGKVVSESVGFADDWYTPFNLKRLPKLSGGSYVRTRGYGGLTPEDITLALQTGAHRVTVVSNSGVFSLELDPRARTFGHRFGFGGTAMQRRYAKSLDAIANSRIKNPQAPEKSLQLDHLGYKTALSDLKTKYPYFVTRVRAEPPINASAKYRDEHDVEHTPGQADAHKVDEGYVRPLSIRASGARYGWADKDVNTVSGQQLVNGKVAYDQLDNYRLGRMGNVIAAAATAAAAPTASNGSRPAGNSAAQPTHRGDTPVAGGQMQDPAYNNPAQRLSTPDANRLYADLKAIVTAHPDIEVGDFDVVRETLLNADHGGPDWTRLRDKLRDNLEFRESVLTDVDEHFGATKKAQELLPGLDSLAVGGDEEDDDGLDEDGFYTDQHLLPDEVIASSPRVTNWVNTLRGREDAESVKLAKDFDWFRDQMARNHKSSNWDAYGEMSQANQERFDTVHTAVVRMINDDIDVERDKKLHPEVDTKPDTPAARTADAAEQATRAPQDMITFNIREALAAPLPKNYAQDLVEDVAAIYGEDQKGAAAKVHSLRQSVERQATSAANEADQKKLREIAAHLAAVHDYLTNEDFS